MITFRLVHYPPARIFPSFFGAIDAVGSLEGALEKITSISAAAVGIGSAEAAIAVMETIAGTAQGVGLLNAPIAATITLDGNAGALGLMQGVLENLGSIEGNVEAVGAATAALTRLLEIAGSGAGVGALAGDITFQLVNLVPPSTPTGDLLEGEILTSPDTGIWGGTPPITYVRQWYRADPVLDDDDQPLLDDDDQLLYTDEETIIGATGAELLLGVSEAGKVIFVRVTASRTGESLVEDSAEVGLVVGIVHSYAAATLLISAA